MDSEKEKSAVPTDHSEDDESDRSGASPRRKQKRKTKEVLPDWTKNPKKAIECATTLIYYYYAHNIFFPRLLSSDDEITILDRIENKTPNGKRDNGGTPRRSTKRARSRSRSITPPPAVPLYALQNARDTVR